MRHEHRAHHAKRPIDLLLPRLPAALTSRSDPNRREILALLRGGPRTAGEIARHFSTSWATVSRHLAVLRSRAYPGGYRSMSPERRDLARLDDSSLWVPAFEGVVRDCCRSQLRNLVFRLSSGSSGIAAVRGSAILTQRVAEVRRGRRGTSTMGEDLFGCSSSSSGISERCRSGSPRDC